MAIATLDEFISTLQKSLYMKAIMARSKIVEKEFETKLAAEAFLEGIEYVNDSSIEVLGVREYIRSGTGQYVYVSVILDYDNSK